MTVTVIGNNSGDDYAGQDDTALRNGGNADNNFDADVREVQIDHWNATAQVNSILKFTGLSNIPAADIVTAVSFGLYQFNGDGTFSIDGDRLTQNWVADEATWNDYSTGNAWTTGGGEDTAGNVWNSGQYGTTVQYTVISDAQILADVQDWIDGTESNYGWQLIQSELTEYSIYKEIRGKDGVDGNQPYLSVTHAPSTSAGTAAMAFGVSSADVGHGPVTGTAPVALDSTADLKGEGVLSATAAMIFDSSAGLYGLLQHQSAFRFGKDDGSESAHTWYADENVNVSLAFTRTAIIRIGVDNDGTPPPQQMKLQVKQTSDPDSAYQDVPVA